MFTSNANSRKPMRVRAMTVAGGIALIGATGAGMAGSANAATTSSAATTLAKIKYCESGNNYQAQNPTSSASGAYQFLDTTWQSLSASAGYASAASAPASVQDAAALELYNQAGTTPWAASSSCWSSMTSAPSTSSTSSSSSSTTSTASTPTAATKAATATSSTAPAAKGKAKATPHGKDANKQAPKGHGGHAGKHHAKPNAPKPPKNVGNQVPPKPGAHKPGKPADARHTGHDKPAPKKVHRAGHAAPAEYAPAKAAA